MLNEIAQKQLIEDDFRFNVLFKTINKKSIIQEIAIKFRKLWMWHGPIIYGSELFLLVIKSPRLSHGLE